MPKEDHKQQKLAEVVERYRRSGLYTHAYAATGPLDRTVSEKTSLSYGDAHEFFDLSSLTKAFCTTSLIFASLKKENLSVDATLAEWFGSTDSNPLADKLKAFAHLPIARILAHTAGLPAWRNFYVCRLSGDKNADALLAEPNRSHHIIETLERVALTPLSQARDLYSDLGFILLGLLLEKKYKKRLDDLFARFVEDELELPSMIVAYRPELSHVAPEKFATTGWCAIRGRKLFGEVHDENCAALGGVSGHSGLFAKGPDVVTFMQALSESDIGRELITTNAKHIKPGNPSLLGYRQGNDEAVSGFASGLSMGHWGFTGTGFWFCPRTNRYAIFLTNRVASARLSSEIKTCRREVFTILDEISR